MSQDKCVETAVVEIELGSSIHPRSEKSSARQHISSARKPGELEGACAPMVGGRQAREDDESQSVGAWCLEAGNLREVGRAHNQGNR
jgi:hypothetical protein